MNSTLGSVVPLAMFLNMTRFQLIQQTTMREVVGIKIKMHRSPSHYSRRDTENHKKVNFWLNAPYQKIFNSKFFAASTHGVLTHAGFRKYNWFG